VGTPVLQKSCWKLLKTKESVVKSQQKIAKEGSILELDGLSLKNLKMFAPVVARAVAASPGLSLADAQDGPFSNGCESAALEFEVYFTIHS
jgi:hypothetical protein